MPHFGVLAAQLGMLGGFGIWIFAGFALPAIITAFCKTASWAIERPEAPRAHPDAYVHHKVAWPADQLDGLLAMEEDTLLPSAIWPAWVRAEMDQCASVEEFMAAVAARGLEHSA